MKNLLNLSYFLMPHTFEKNLLWIGNHPQIGSWNIMTFDLWHKYPDMDKRSLSFCFCMYAFHFFFASLYFFLLYLFFSPSYLTMPGDARDIIPLFLYFEAMVADNWIRSFTQVV